MPLEIMLDSTPRRPARGRARTIRRAFAAGIPAILLASFVLGGTATAAAAPGVACGSTVTTNLTLTADLRCPSGDGIILGPDVTLDLGGHRLIGSGSGIGVQTTDFSTGGNTITNGTIKNWATGLLLDERDAAPYTVSDVVFRTAPISHMDGNTTLQLTRVTAVDSRIEAFEGVLAVWQSRLTRSDVVSFFASTTFTDSTLVQSPIESAAGGSVRIESSRLDGKGTGAPGTVSETRITIDNSVVRNFAQPITGFWGAATLTDSTFSNMPNGVLGDISFNLGVDVTSHIVGNTFSRSGVVLRGNVPMIVENNIFKNNEVAVEFTRMTPFEGMPPFTAEDSRAVGNVITKSTGTGILTELSGLSVGSNTATKNGGYGIYAPGAVDLGGNVAYGNALGQCVGVVCAGR